LTTPRARGFLSLFAALLSCGWRTSRRLPHDLAPYGLGAPVTWFRSTSRYSIRGAAIRDPDGCSSLRLRSAPEFDPSRRAPSCTLSEVSDPQAQPSHRGPPLPAVCLPGSRCALTLTMRLGALLPRRPPWCTFNQARSRDHHPSELHLTASAALLSEPALPLAISHAGPQSTLSRSPVLRANSKLASLQGLSRCRLGLRRENGFPRARKPWLSWVLPPWGSPLPCSDLQDHGAIR